MAQTTGINTITACSVCYGWNIYYVTLGHRGTVEVGGQQWHIHNNKLNFKKSFLKNNLLNLAKKLGTKCLSNVFTVCILAYISWLTVIVPACTGFL